MQLSKTMLFSNRLSMEKSKTEHLRFIKPSDNPLHRTNHLESVCQQSHQQGIPRQEQCSSFADSSSGSMLDWVVCEQFGRATDLGGVRGKIFPF